jgi:4-hydroxyphenylacetate 3-monooxygenase
MLASSLKPVEDIKTAADHLRSLRDGRVISIDGEIVTDHVTHPAFRRAVQTAAGIYDYAAKPANRERMTFRSPTSGASVSRAWQLPTCYEELLERRKAIEEIAQLTCGWVGRTPEHVASALGAMVMGIDLFERHGHARAAAVNEYFTYARDRDIWCVYSIVPPQSDRSPKGAAGQPDFVNAGVCDEDHEGITVRGTRMLATAAPLAQELLVAAVQPLKPGEERYSFTAMVPLDARGLKLLSRRSYEANATSEFDHPLSSRFDESDCIVYFDDVKIPWERVFVHNDVNVARAQWVDIPVLTYQNYPAQVRLTVKLRFLLGLAHRIASSNGIQGLQSTQETLGQMAAELTLVEAMVTAMETVGQRFGKYYLPNPSIQLSSMVLSQQLYPLFLLRIRELCGGGALALPSSYRDLLNPDIGPYFERGQRGNAGERFKLFKLAWDAVGSEFASRHAQYEMFYAGPSFASRLRNYNAYDWDRATGLVDGLLGQIDAPAPSPGQISAARVSR